MAQKLGLGLILPVQGGSVGYFNTAFDAITQVKSNLINLILTRKGERVMLPSFGCNIHNFLFEEMTDDLVANVKGSIQEAVQLWMPFVSIDDIRIQNNERSHQVFVQVTFHLKTALNITDSITIAVG